MIRSCVSMLCWDRWDDENVWKSLASVGVREIELVPTKVWPGWEGFKVSHAKEVRRRVEDAGFSIPSAQSLAFGVEGISVFGADLAGGVRGQEAQTQRQRFLDHLERVFEVGAHLGARFYVFGSPKLRRREAISDTECDEIALGFFKDLGNRAVAHGAVVALEANATDYGCDWLTNSVDLEKFVIRLSHPGVGLHLDVGNMRMMGEDLETRLQALLPRAVHFHLSAPKMAPILGDDVAQLKTILATQKFAWPQRISLEQKYESAEAFEKSLQAIGEIPEWGN